MSGNRGLAQGRDYAVQSNSMPLIPQLCRAPKSAGILTVDLRSHSIIKAFIVITI
jgi:hypothetical protein